MRHKAKSTLKARPGVRGSSLAMSSTGNSRRPLGLFRDPPKGVK